MRALFAGFIVAGACLLGSSAGAQVDVRALGRALADAEADGRQGSAFLRSERFSAIVRLPDGIDGREQGLSLVAPGWAVVRGPLRRLAELANEQPEWAFSWQPPLRPLLDRAGELTGAPAYRAETNRTGRGVVIGIVDTGVDVYHDDLRNADGTTRIAWLIDMMGEPQGGVHASIEALCNVDVDERFEASGLSCGVYSAVEVDAIIANNERPDIARDPAGHGTHIASLAAGNGRASNGLYVGVAPEATLIVARVAGGATANIEAVDVLKAVELIYWLAREEPVARGLPPMPAVVNVSLGSDLGPHDGSAPFAESLAALVGDDQPGRALVVAAGNSGTLYDASSVYPNPLGVHTEVHVTPQSSVRVPVLTYPPPFPRDTPHSSVFIWIEFRPGDRISVGLERASGRDTELAAPGETVSRDDGPLSVTVLNGALAAQGFQDGMDAAFVAIEGEWPPGETFAVRLEGHGTATLWVQTEGDIAPSAGGLGAHFPAATQLMTVTNPAAHPELIAVGATINRSSWTDRTGREVTVEIGGSTPTPDAVAFFSSAGPNGAGRIKPDLVAPGGWVVGSLSRDADPALSALSIFGTRATCEPHADQQRFRDCAVVDATHAVTAGTSMAAPMVAGAGALLFEGAPELTQRQVRARLQAGARRLTRGASPQQGAGALDLPGALAVERAELSSAGLEPSAERSWMVTSNAFVRPDPRASLHGLLQLRSADGLPADGFDGQRLSLEASPGVVREEPTRLAPGLWQFEVAAADGTGGDDLVLQARFDGEPLLTARLPIAVDVHVAEGGFSAEGGCTTAAHKGSFANAAHLLLALSLWIMRKWGVRRDATRFGRVSTRSIARDRSTFAQCEGATRALQIA